MMSVAGQPLLSMRAGRDPRVDVLRGAALLMIFVDHVPPDLLNTVTLHGFGFCDAAEVFVLLAGFSSFAAYDRGLGQNLAGGLQRIGRRCLRIYLTHVGLLVAMLGAAGLWLARDPTVAPLVAPLQALVAHGVVQAFTLRAMPEYLDILPLYIVLLGLFPLIWLAARFGMWVALGASGAVWALAFMWHGLNLPNATDPNGWYFNPFAWQFLFTIGVALALQARRGGGDLPRARSLVMLCVLYLAFACSQALPWNDWGPTALRSVVLPPPDKSHLSFLRILNILSIIYLVMSSSWTRQAARHRFAQAFALCGRHSLEVFAVGCVLALLGRLSFHSFGAGPGMQVAVNLIGAAGMLGVALVREQLRATAHGPDRVASKTGAADLAGYDAVVLGGD